MRLRGEESGLPGADGGRLVSDGGRADAFCAGAARAAFGARAAEAVPVTSYQYQTARCNGGVLDFHTTPQLGFSIAVGVCAMTELLTSATYQLATYAGPMTVTIVKDSGAAPSPRKQGVEGTLVSEHQGGFEEPTWVTLCAQVADGTDPLDGARVWSSRVPLAGVSWDERFSIWLLEDATITAIQAAQRPLADLVLARNKLLGLSQIRFYEGPVHRVHLVYTSKDLLLRQVPKVGLSGVPFVVVADGNRVYLGAFWTMLSSLAFDGPTVDIEMMASDAFTVGPAQLAPDRRGDVAVVKALSESGKYLP